MGLIRFGLIQIKVLNDYYTPKISKVKFETMRKKNYLCQRLQMVVVAQLVRALDCGSRGRRFEPGLPPLFSL